MIHGRNFASRVPHAKMVAVSDTVEESARTAAGELGIDTWYTDYRQALENRAVDAVIVVTPTKFHHNIVTEAAKAGKHILCEKPMAMSREECQGMIDAAQENKVKLQIGFMRRFDANFRRAKEIVDSGEIGEVVSVKSLTRGPSTPQEWMYDIRKSNGPLAEVNSHDIDTLRWFTGSEAVSLYAMAGNYRCKAVREQYPDFYDTVLMNVRMRNGMMGNIDGAQGVQYGYDARVDILGTNGSVHIGGLTGSTTLTYTKNHRMSADVIRSWTNLFYEAYVNEDIGFIGAIREDREPEVRGVDGMMAVDIVRAGNESIQKGQIIYLS
jgi:myo-inositol 2-dehydrogenase/D-chiro-inositol 1-dehydrogenase/scyllo-inositol 2-dehydrogenase (NAD+)